MRGMQHTNSVSMERKRESERLLNSNGYLMAGIGLRKRLSSVTAGYLNEAAKTNEWKADEVKLRHTRWNGMPPTQLHNKCIKKSDM